MRWIHSATGNEAVLRQQENGPTGCFRHLLYQLDIGQFEEYSSEKVKHEVTTWELNTSSIGMLLARELPGSL